MKSRKRVLPGKAGPGPLPVRYKAGTRIDWQDGVGRGILCVLEMMRLFDSSTITARTLRAQVCLLAVLLLWLPLGASAWQACNMACCADGMCMAHGRSHSPKAAPPSEPAKQGSGEMDCHHSGQSDADGMLACKMDCCHTQQQAMASPIIFLLRAEPALAGLGFCVGSPKTVSAAAASLPFLPSLPPPRIHAS